MCAKVIHTIGKVKFTKFTEHRLQCTTRKSEREKKKENPSKNQDHFE